MQWIGQSSIWKSSKSCVKYDELPSRDLKEWCRSTSDYTPSLDGQRGSFTAKHIHLTQTHPGAWSFDLLARLFLQPTLEGWSLSRQQVKV